MSVERVKEYLRQGKVAQLAQWAKENKIKDVDKLIDKAYEELRKERK